MKYDFGLLTCFLADS